MSSKERRQQRERELEQERIARSIEQDRWDKLNLFMKIEELEVDEKVKDVLHRLAMGEREDL
jgi:hypothetical protein